MYVCCVHQITLCFVTEVCRFNTFLFSFLKTNSLKLFIHSAVCYFQAPNPWYVGLNHSCLFFYCHPVGISDYNQYFHKAGDATWFQRTNVVHFWWNTVEKKYNRWSFTLLWWMYTYLCCLGILSTQATYTDLCQLRSKIKEEALTLHPAIQSLVWNGYLQFNFAQKWGALLQDREAESFKSPGLSHLKRLCFNK